MFAPAEGSGSTLRTSVAQFNSARGYEWVAIWDRLGLQIRACSVRFAGGPLRGLGLVDGEREEEAKAQLGESPGDHAFAPSRVNSCFIRSSSRVQIPPVRRSFFEV